MHCAKQNQLTCPKDEAKPTKAKNPQMMSHLNIHGKKKKTSKSKWKLTTSQKLYISINNLVHNVNLPLKWYDWHKWYSFGLNYNKKKKYFTLIKTWMKTIRENAQLKSEMNIQFILCFSTKKKIFSIYFVFSQPSWIFNSYFASQQKKINLQYILYPFSCKNNSS